MKTPVPLFTNATANGTSAAVPNNGPSTVQSIITGTGTYSCTVSIYGINANQITNGLLLATMSVSNTQATDGGNIPAAWPFVYAVITNASGTFSVNTTVAS
jgi:hypothetical protein